jgi:multidrug efflux pump subunit AcrA (membrane-fusion protein)
MVSKELKRLSRRELVDIIYQLKKNEQQLQEKITALEAALEEKRLRISKAGSVAEAAVSVSNVLSAAQEAADLYLHEIACMKAEAEQECERILAQARNTASGSSPAPKMPAVPVPVIRQDEPSRLRKVSQLVRRWKR